MARFAKHLRPVFDTNVFVNFLEHLSKKEFYKVSFSIVVLYELVARPIAPENFEIFDEWRATYKDLDRLIIPNYDDIWTSAQAVRKLRLAQQKLHKGITPAMENATKFQNDAVIARSAFANDCFLVTANTKDFDELRKFMRFDYVTAQDYFGL